MAWQLRTILLAFLVVAGSMLAPMALADEAIATVRDVEGEVTAGPSRNERRSLETGSPIFEGDWIESDETGGAVIQFQVGSWVTMGPATDIDIRSYLPTAGQPNTSLIHIYEGVVRFDLRGTAGHVIGLQTNTAVIEGGAGVWTVVAEEWETAVWVQSGLIEVQGFEPGRDTVGAAQVVRQGQFVQVPASAAAPAPRDLTQADLNAILRRMGGRFD